MVINIIKDSKSDSKQPVVYDLGTVTTTLQALLDNSRITITDKQVILLKVTNLDTTVSYYFIPFRDYQGESLYGYGKEIVVSDLIPIGIDGGGVTPQTLAETLAIDNKTNNIHIVSNNGMARVNVNDNYLDIGYDNNYLFLEPTTGVQLYSDVGVFTTAPEMGATIDNVISYTCPSFLLNTEEVATQPYADAKVADDLTASTTVAPSKTAVNTALALKQNIPFEIQITQVLPLTAPTILSGSENGLRGATLTTNYISDGDYTIVADLPIFANAKDCYKGVNNIPFNLIIEWENSWLYAWFWYISDDYTIKVRTSVNTGFFDPSDGVLGDPVLIKIEYKN